MTIYLLTMPDGTFGSAGQSWKKLDLDMVKSKLNFAITISSIDKIEDLDFQANDVVIYTSSENEIIRSYLKNKLYYLKDKVTLIPRYELLMAHEDKGFQEILKKERRLGNLEGNYIFDIDNHKMDYPKVLKTSQGAGSSGVFLVKDQEDLQKIKDGYFSNSIKENIIAAQRKLKLSESEYQIYSYRKKKFNLFVEQEFIPNLQFDFKILIFGDRYFVLKRKVRKNDFRASGSGDFQFDAEPPHDVFDFAKKISQTLNNPYFSLDIVQSDRGCHLIEFQCTNFGPIALLNAPNRFVMNNGEWVKETNCKNLEANYAYALNHYMNGKYD